MGLTDYNEKRKFDDTPEPPGRADRKNLGRFVVQRHRASSLHYDLRLEMEGVLRSWAIPKGPSMNPGDKRLAIHTEDHPVKYLTFEGTIPKGNYGAGVMKIWDAGTYRTPGKADHADAPAQYKKGDLKIEFHGGKLKGTFALVHTNRGKAQNQWLLIKKTDDFSTEMPYDAESLPPVGEKHSAVIKNLKTEQFVAPMLAGVGGKIFDDPDWVFELKWDGYRMISHITDGKVQMYSRNGISFNTKFVRIEKQLRRISHDTILDGEVVVVDKNGLNDFQLLQNYDENTPGTLRYYVFDMLFLNGHSMLDLPLLERKSLIPDVIEGLQEIVYCEHIEGLGKAFYEKATGAGMEGLIAKKADSIYSPGFRTSSWLKIKRVESAEAIICGFTESTKGGVPFGSLILGMYEKGKLRYIGNCGSGFSDVYQKDLLKKLEAIEIKSSPFDKKINLKGRAPHWVKPEIICEVKFSEWTKSGQLRHPVFKALRDDKSTTEISVEGYEEMKDLPENIKGSEPNHSEPAQEDSDDYIDPAQVHFTNLDKIYFPKTGIRKYDLIDYYQKIAETILPYLIDRPQNLHRHPEGITKKGFYQKNSEDEPEWIETIPLYSGSAKREIAYLLCQNEATLLHMANMGCIELNPWSSRVNSLEFPDYTVIDLDPSTKSTFPQLIEVALTAKEILDAAGINASCKTSGSDGLHIYIPLGAQYTYDEARDFTKLLCYHIRDRLPKTTSMERIIKNRKGKIYLDYLQNRKGQTLASAYCVRPREGAPVSTPLLWAEVNEKLRISDFNIHTVPKRILEIGDLFIPVLQEGIDMAKVLEKGEL